MNMRETAGMNTKSLLYRILKKLGFNSDKFAIAGN
jgi:hypothetical protein